MTSPSCTHLEGHIGYAVSLSFSPVSTRLCSGRSDHTIKVWNLLEGTVRVRVRDPVYASPETFATNF